MVRRITPSQYRARVQSAISRVNQAIQQHKQKVQRVVRAQKQAIGNYNRAVQQYNQRVRQAVSKYNNSIRTHNTGVHAHNARVRADRQTLLRQLNALRNQPAQTRIVRYGDSTVRLQERYERIEHLRGQSDVYDQLLDSSARESANSAAVLNSLLSDEASAHADHADTGIVECLEALSPDLRDRWKGAVFALKPENPDAARHFCTSVREIFTTVLELMAPDEDVLRGVGNCQLTQNGKPTRRAKISYLLQVRGIENSEVTDFVDADIDNILDLFTVFNEATHGPAGKHSWSKLKTIRTRVEDGIMFLTALPV